MTELTVSDVFDVPFEPTLELAEARQQLAGLLAKEQDLIANAANTAAFLNTLLPEINWVGFYFLRDSLHDASNDPSGDKELVLGPFQGNPACVRIPAGRGVCGHCVASGETQRVDDVHAFPGHIACDIRSRSELVVPVWAAGRIVAVMDIDSPSPGRFSVQDQAFVEALMHDFSVHQFGES